MSISDSRHARALKSVLLAAVGVLSLSAGVPAITVGVANAAETVKPPPVITDQVPGYFRFKLGDFVVTALYDGYIDLQSKLFKGVEPQDFRALLDRMFVDSENGAQTAVNGFLIHTGDHLTLIDTGAAKVFGPTLGVITENVVAAGYAPEQVDTVLLTHLHPDHASGLMSPEGKVVFPNATVWTSKTEADFWLSDEVAAKMPEGMRPMFQLAQKAVAEYRTAGRFKTFAPGEPFPVPGITPVDTSGHTPGHSGYMVTSKNANLLVWGDIVHSYAAQFRRPDISLEFDVDQPAAIATRKKLFDLAAREKLWVAGAHLPFPGIGHVRDDGDGAYAWVPVEYGPLRADR